MMKECNICKKTKDEDEFYKINGATLSSRCKDCTIDINKKRHRELFKYNSSIYQCILFNLGEKTRTYVNEDWVNGFIEELKSNSEFDIHEVKDSVVKRLIQRCHAQRVKPKIESEFNKILEKV